MADAVEFTAAAAHQGAISRVVSEDAAEEQPLRLGAPHPFFDGKSETYIPLFGEMPRDVDWYQSKCIEEHFPKQKKCGGKQVPMSLILDCQTDKDKFLVVQWWRSRSPKQQQDAITSLREFYKRYTVSNDKISNEKQAAMQKALEQNARTMGKIRRKVTQDRVLMGDTNN